MSKKAIKPSKAKASKPSKAKASYPRKKNDVVTESNLQNDVLVNEKMRDKMVKALLKSEGDMLYIAQLHDRGSEAAKEKINNHYKKFGSVFINAVFRGDLAEAVQYASETDKKIIQDL